MLTDRDDLTQAWSAQYGRLCMMTAKALQAGHSRAHVTEAARGQGKQPSPVYVALRKQRLITNQALVLSKAAGANLDDLVPTARRLRNMAEGEWSVSIPIFAKVGR